MEEFDGRRQIGRPRGTTQSEDELLAAAARQLPSCTASELLERLNLPVSRSTVYRRLTEAGLHIRSSVGRPPQIESQVSVKPSRDTNDKATLSVLAESAPKVSAFIPILPKPTATNFSVAIALQPIQATLEQYSEGAENFSVAVRPTRPTLEERCRDMCMSLPDLSNVKVLPIEKTKCAVAHCGHSQERNPDLYFFPFPKEAKRCAMWLINCDRLDLFKKDLPTITNQCIVCEDHFAVSQYYMQTLFRDNYLTRKKRLNQYYEESELSLDCITSEIPARKKRLICNAVPTLFNIPSRPPKKNIDMPELHETSLISVQEQYDDLQVILLPPSPKQQTNGSVDAHINGDIEMEEDYNDIRNDSPEKDLICEVNNSNDQNGYNSTSDFCVEIPTQMDVEPAHPNISLFKDENMAIVKSQRFNNNHSDTYSTVFDIAKTIRSILEKKAEPKYETWIKDINELKAFGENSFQEKKNAVDNAFKAIEEDIKNMIVELQTPEQNEVIDISDDEVQESTLPEGIVLSPLPKQVSFVTTANKRPLTDRVFLLNKHQKHHNAVQINRNSFSSIDSSTDIIQIAQISITRPNLPAIGPVKRRDVVPGMHVIASKLSFLHSWCRAVVLDALKGTQGEKLFRIRFEGRKNGGSLCTGKQLAYTDNPAVILPVGSRVVATFKKESKETELHAGIVAEPPKVMNNYRYLIFFDSGHAQYVSHKEIHLVCEADKEVWEDIHQESKEFIKGYLMQYPERPMVKLQKGQTVSTELNGTWLSALVKDVDASLVKLEFENKQMEWIYRGSTRLAPLYNELATAQANRLTGKFRRHHLVGKRAHQPYVEYTRGIDEPIARPTQNNATVRTPIKEKQTLNQSVDVRPQVAKKQTGGTLPNASTETTRIAKKSTTHERLMYNLMSDEFSNNVLQSELGQREVHMIETKEHYKYYNHVCSSACCNAMEQNLSKYKGDNPLRIPTLCGWERQIVKQRATSKRAVFYRAPCSRRLRSIEEINRYLWYTHSKLTIDLFCFDSDVHTFSEFTPSKVLFSIPDVSYGKEDIPVPCVNSLYNEEPIYVPYSNVRFPAKGVHLNLDPEFLCGCDCEDNCQDSSKCSCQQLTVNATEALPSGKVPDAGYKYRRLKEPIITGIYECNTKCKCGSSCMNRVVQNGLQVRLQLFRTERKGWGIRCLDDIPQGMFICIYAGQLLTEQGANEDGHQYGDEYLAELDHIEVVERLKEGYESDVIEPDNESEDSDSEDDSSSESSSSSSVEPRKSKYESDSDFDADIGSPVESAPHSFRLRTRKIPNADDNSSASESSLNNDQSSNLVPNPSEDAYLSPPKLARQPSNSLDGQDKDMSPLGVNTSENGACNPPVLSPNLPEVKKVTVPWPSNLPSNKKTDKDSISEDSSTNDEEPNIVKSLFGNLPDPNSGPLVSKTEGEEKSSMVSVRQYFNEEYCYIMDAKNCGNIGRYLNHSCNPNVFVQNVFVDTHDLRFPWVAFFAMVYIRAGSELTWDYNYDVGSVPGKVMYCYCASAECRGRLL